MDIVLTITLTHGDINDTVTVHMLTINIILCARHVKIMMTHTRTTLYYSVVGVCLMIYGLVREVGSLAEISGLVSLTLTNLSRAKR